MDANINLATLIRDRAASDPQRTAIKFGRRQISYSAFARNIETVAGALAAEGVEPSMKVGIEVGEPYAHWVVMMASMRLGGISASLDIRGGALRAGIVDFDFMLSSRPDSDLKEFCRKFVCVSDEWIKKFKSSNEESDLPDPDLADRSLGRIVFSSGTTGTPKGILIPSKSLKLTTENQSQIVNESSKYLCGYGIETSPTRDLATWDVGGTVVFAYSARRRKEELSRVVEEADFIATSSASLVGIMSSTTKEFEGKDSRIVRAGGAPLPITLRDEALARLCGHVEIGYGCMEVGTMAGGDASLLDRHPGAVGFEHPGTELQVVDDDGRQVPAGEEGTIRVRSATMVQGYINNQEATAEFFRNGWFYPGDMGIKHGDGLIVVLGRESDVFNVGGVKFSASAVEHEVLQVDHVSDACALAVPDRWGVNTLMVLVVCGEGYSEKKQKAEISRRLATIEIRNFTLRQVPKIPRNERGKIPRKRVAEDLSKTL